MKKKVFESIIIRNNATFTKLLILFIMYIKQHFWIFKIKIMFDFLIFFITTDFENSDVFMNMFWIDLEVSPILVLSQPVHVIEYTPTSWFSSVYVLSS